MSRLKALVLAAAITPLLGACVIYDSSASDAVSVRVGSNTAVVATEPLEVMRGVRFEPGAMVVQAESNGCTSEASFAVEITESDGSAKVSLTRQTPDPCRALAPEGVELRWTYDELGMASGEDVTILNPVRLP